jgi:hypothetical protein
MSHIPAALDYLVATLPVKLTDDVQVIDGPPVVNLENTGIAVGYTPDELAVSSLEDPAGLDSNVETFDINCLVWARSGDIGMKAIRDLVFTIVTAVDEIIRLDPNLGGAVATARLRILDLDQMQNSDGTWAVVAFAITCKAFK